MALNEKGVTIKDRNRTVRLDAPSSKKVSQSFFGTVNVRAFDALNYPFIKQHGFYFRLQPSIKFKK